MRSGRNFTAERTCTGLGEKTLWVVPYFIISRVTSLGLEFPAGERARSPS